MGGEINSMASNIGDTNGVSAPAFVCVSPFLEEHTEFFTTAKAQGGNATLDTLKTGTLAITSASGGTRSRLKRCRARGNYPRVPGYETNDAHQYHDEGGVSLRRRRRVVREEVGSMEHGEVSPSASRQKRTAFTVNDPSMSARRKVYCIPYTIPF